ncbi:uncharacterized protein GGS22DRAFT_199794 [Annulohypoxylon maeteangense]|uniref:uncharacterized protein n=1 Tax=Annulohypoxylon maeteangense TaxID=1927788 RepID=UPI00200727C3|nr:uncharacterized protein GGS22DRAFT_199794 [Annulohypoxylon maeteangense]KAI0885497.1 hypothetical protein GGS22DRAFT_199794 [Annulohypoxylon maeteangense]
MSRSTAINLSEEALSRETQLSLPIRSIQHSHSSAQTATLIHQRQNNLEHSNFEHIKLTLWNLPELSLVTHGNRAQVRCISLSLQLEGDSGRLWEVPPHNKRSPRTADNSVITTAMHDLFWILSSWGSQRQLNLEIEIYSPSRKPFDSFEQALTPADRVILGNSSSAFLNAACEERWWQTLPEAPAVTSLLLKVRHDRAWRPRTLDNLVSRLPSLEEFRYETIPQDPAADSILIHHNPSFSAKRWSRALAYYRRISEQYFTVPFNACDDMSEFEALLNPTDL